MNMKILPPARVEVQEAFAYYQAISADVARSFVQEFRDAISAIREAPTAWSSFNDRFRKKNLHRFPYGIAYRIAGEEIIVAAFMNLNRDLNRWQDRWDRT